MGVFHNYILTCSIICWFAAQVLKFIFVLIVQKKVQLERFVGSGGMPSAHTAIVCGMTVSSAQYSGVDSPIFAIAFILACIVMYDAMGVRRQAGEHARLLNRMLRDDEYDDDDEDVTELKEKLGHTPLEVLAGAMLGILIPMLFNLIIF